jgi:hypothetical protein
MDKSSKAYAAAAVLKDRLYARGNAIYPMDVDLIAEAMQEFANAEVRELQAEILGQGRAVLDMQGGMNALTMERDAFRAEVEMRKAGAIKLVQENDKLRTAVVKLGAELETERARRLAAEDGETCPVCVPGLRKD